VCICVYVCVRWGGRVSTIKIDVVGGADIGGKECVVFARVVQPEGPHPLSQSIYVGIR